MSSTAKSGNLPPAQSEELQSTADMTQFVQTLLNQMQTRFQSMSENIISKIGSRVGPIPGMESVVATVSGYHGSERFKLIKFISQTGASYVGSMGRSITHLVCWQFAGKKYDMARQLGAHIVSHRWFEDFLKEGKRLPEGLYSMQSGAEVGPILWQLPVILDTHGKEKSILSSERVVLSDRSNAMDLRGIADIELEWSDSHLFNEKSSGMNKKIKCSKNFEKSKKCMKQGYGSSNKGNPTLPANGLRKRPESSSSSKNKRNFGDASGTDVTGDTLRRSLRIKRESAPANSLNPVMLDCNLTESNNVLQTRNHVSGDSNSLNDPIVLSPNQGIIDSEIASTILERRHLKDDTGENFHVSNYSNSSNSNALSVPETLQNEYSEDTREMTDFCNGGEDQNDETAGSDELGELATQHTETGLSCVICWTVFSSTRGILPCGHRFCYSCIQEWADCMNSRGKVSTCPLCKTGFTHIIKCDETTSSDQKIYSQTIPCGPLRTDLLMTPVTTYRLQSCIMHWILFVITVTIASLKIFLYAAVSAVTNGCILTV